jgi:hypothetical protein
MIFMVLADIVVAIHFLWIMFLIFGAIAGIRYRAAKYIHIAGLFFAMVIQVFGWYCPLTHLEVWLRYHRDPSLTYEGSFITYYIEKLVYLNISPSILIILTIVLVLFNVWFYKGTSVKRKRG